MAPLVAQHVDHEIGGAVNDLGIVGEIRSRIDEPVEAQQLHDAVEIAQGGLGLRQDIERTEPCRFLALSQINARAKLACDSYLAVTQGQLSGDEQQIAEMKERYVVGDWRRELGQRDVQRPQPCFDFACHIASACPAIGLDHRANMAVLQACLSPL
jgi:hypothetical protein